MPAGRGPTSPRDCTRPTTRKTALRPQGAWYPKQATLDFAVARSRHYAIVRTSLQRREGVRSLRCPHAKARCMGRSVGCASAPPNTKVRLSQNRNASSWGVFYSTQPHILWSLTRWSRRRFPRGYRPTWYCATGYAAFTTGTLKDGAPLARGTGRGRCRAGAGGGGRERGCSSRAASPKVRMPRVAAPGGARPG